MAVGAGAFTGYRFGGNALGQGAVQLELIAPHDVSQAHDGLLLTAAPAMPPFRTPDPFLSLDVQTTWADADYTRTYFGILPADAQRPGPKIRVPASAMSVPWRELPHYG